MPSRLSRVAVPVALAAAFVAAAVMPSASLAAPTLGRCPGAGATDRSTCMTVRVPLDRTGTLPGSIALRVRMIRPATGTPSQTILVLAGGPGQAAAPLLPRIAESLGPIRRGRQLVTFDQRGTGASGPLSCTKAASGARSAGDAVARCARALGPRRIAYTTAESVADIDAVRTAIGVDRLVLYGTSYGTKVALDYAAAHPDHVERLVLDSTLGPAGVDPLDRSTIAAFGPMLDDLCRGGGCPFAGGGAAVLDAAVRRVRRAPVPARAVLPNGRVIVGKVRESTVLANLLASDLRPDMRAGLPAALASLAHGDGAPLLALGGVGGGGGGGGGVSAALFLATTCEDTTGAWPAGTPVQNRAAALDATLASLPPQTWAPFSAKAAADVGMARACITWPESPISQPPFAPPTMPTLVLSGAQDLRTPPSDAAALAATSPTVQVLTVPDTGHSVISSERGTCAVAGVQAFLTDQPVQPCPATPRTRLAIDPVAPTSLGAVPATPGLPSRTGRTWHAVQLTAADLLHRLQWVTQTPDGLAVGGLRGGRAVVNLRKGLTLDRYSYIPGVTLDTALPVRGAIPIHIGGRVSGRAVLDLRHHRITADIDGRHLRAALPASAVARLLGG